MICKGRWQQLGKKRHWHLRDGASRLVKAGTLVKLLLRKRGTYFTTIISTIASLHLGKKKHIEKHLHISIFWIYINIIWDAFLSSNSVSWKLGRLGSPNLKCLLVATATGGGGSELGYLITVDHKWFSILNKTTTNIFSNSFPAVSDSEIPSRKNPNTNIIMK